MREKVKRLLDLVRAGRLSLEDAAPLLAALSPKLALTDPDREFVASLLARTELDTGQVAEQLLLLRGVRETPPPPPFPPRPPQFSGEWRGTDRGGRRYNGSFSDVEGLMDSVGSMVGRVGEVVGTMNGGPFQRNTASPRILRVEVESGEGDEYKANLPVSLAPHLHKLIPPHGLRALERAGLSVEALQLLIEADPPPGDLIDAEDGEGNSVKLSLK
ncbi:hypothetical protein V3W47_02455 [Deinococcus sp. YIM 134068]|uniref:hypothetical protein n=1 Tax=Deinococcus lichenicola TaxID=3118910 RepID=UPI002F94FCB6